MFGKNINKYRTLNSKKIKNLQTNKKRKNIKYNWKLKQSSIKANRVLNLKKFKIFVKRNNFLTKKIKIKFLINRKKTIKKFFFNKWKNFFFRYNKNRLLNVKRFKYVKKYFLVKGIKQLKLIKNIFLPKKPSQKNLRSVKDVLFKKKFLYYLKNRFKKKKKKIINTLK